jgi:PAS domain S-box-containing protein
VLSLAIIALYAWPLVLGNPGFNVFRVDIGAAITAALSAAASVVAYIFASRRDDFWIGYSVFMVFALAVCTLVLTTGGATSPFIALFMLSAFFAGVFGLLGSVPLLVVSIIYVVVVYASGQTALSTSTIIAVSFSSVLPLVAGFIVWYNRDKGAEEDLKDPAVKKIANQLSEVASASEVIINAIGDGVVAIDSQGTIQLINPAAQELLGWTKQDALMLNYKSILHLVDKANKEIDPTVDPIQQALNTNQEVRTSLFSMVTKSGKKMMASIVVSPISEAGSGVIAMFHDITKEKQEEREQAEFVSTASHEMRTPVASIEGYLGLALNPNTAQIDEKARDFIMKAHQAAQHLGRLFQDLLDVSKADDGRMANVPKVIDLIPFVGEIVQGLTQKATDKGLRIVYKPQDNGAQKQIAPVYFVNLDNDHIREVTDNLVENAIKYTPAGEVTVDVTGSEDKVIISIKDSGIGIPAEDMAHLFQKFYRVNNEETNQIGGTGLGLYLCRRLVEAMNGRIWVESEYKKGSTFYVELPRIDSSEAERLKAEQARQVTVQAPAPVAAPDAMPPVVAAPAPEVAPQPGATPSQAATTVPRGESLTREQIAAHVAQLEAMAKQQQAAVAPTEASAPVQTPGQTTGQS